MWQGSLNLILNNQNCWNFTQNCLSKANMTVSNLGKFRAIRLWVGPSKALFTMAVLAESEFQIRFPKYFRFHTLIFPSSSRKMCNNKLRYNNHLYFIFSTIYYTIFYYILHYYTQFRETRWDHGDSKPWEKPWISDTKTELRLMSSGRSRTVGNMHFFVSCQIDVVNKQHFSLFSWNNSLSKINFYRWIPLKRNSPFMRYLFIEYQAGKWSKNFLYWH